MKPRLLPILFFLLSINLANGQQYNINFELNVATLNGNIDPTGIYVGGGTGFGLPGDNPLVDPDGDGIYTGTLVRDAGFASHYTFLNGNCPDWSCKENLTGLPCSDPANFNDRFLPELTGDVTIKACFGTCEDTGDCTIVTDSIQLTFMLNTENIEVDPQGIFLAGGGNFGYPGDNPMIDPDGDGIYEITVTKALGFSSFYTFVNGNCPDFSCKEDLEGLPCGNPDFFNDRFLEPQNESATIMRCFGTCDTDGSCTPLSSNNLEIDESLFRIQPTVINADVANLVFEGDFVFAEKEISVFNNVGQLIASSNDKNNDILEINTSTYSSGIYFVNVRTEHKMLTSKFIINK